MPAAADEECAVKFFESSGGLKDDDAWCGTKTVVDVANHTELKPQAASSEWFLREVAMALAIAMAWAWMAWPWQGPWQQPWLGLWQGPG